MHSRKSSTRHVFSKSYQPVFCEEHPWQNNPPPLYRQSRAPSEYPRSGRCFQNLSGQFSVKNILGEVIHHHCVGNLGLHLVILVGISLEAFGPFTGVYEQQLISYVFVTSLFKVEVAQRLQI